MIDKPKTVSDISNLTNDLLNQFSKFNDQNFNVHPANGGWSAGEVAEHLLMLVKNVNRNLRARAVPAERSADEKVSVFVTVFDDYDRKFNAPEQIIPSTTPKDRTAMLKELDLQHRRLIEVVEEFDLTEICTGFNHPSLGAFTRLEWIYFIIRHAYRHIHQLNNLLAELA